MHLILSLLVFGTFIISCSGNEGFNGPFNGRIVLTPASLVFCESVNVQSPNNTEDEFMLLRFGISYPPGIPFFGVKVLDSRVFITVNNTDPMGASGTLHEMVTSWSASRTDWSAFPNNLGPVEGVDYKSEISGSYSGVASGGTANITVTETVNRWLNPANPNTGWLIKKENKHDIFGCGSSGPKLDVLVGPLPFTFQCFTYKDPEGKLSYPEPFIAYTRLCVFCKGPAGFGQFVVPLFRFGFLVVNGVTIRTTEVDPLPGLDLGYCGTVPPNLNTREITLSFAVSAVHIELDTTEYTTKLPEEIACRSFECENATVVINGTMQGQLLRGDEIVIVDDTTIKGNFSVEGSIAIASQETVIDVQGCLSATSGINIQLKNETYTQGQHVIEILTYCQIENTTDFTLTGGNAERECARLLAESSSTSRGIALTISIDDSGCGSDGSSIKGSFGGTDARVVVPAVVGSVVFVALVITAGMAFYRYQRFHKISLPSLSSRK